MSDWLDAVDPTQRVKDLEERRSNKARAHWQRLRLAKGDVAGRLTYLQSHDSEFERGSGEGA